MGGKKILNFVVIVAIVNLLGCATPPQKVSETDLEEIEEWPEVAKEGIYQEETPRETKLTALKEKVKEYLPGKKTEAPKKTVTPRKPSHIAPARDIQTALKNAGYEPGKIDGKIGPRTTVAIKSFQKDSGLKGDGIVGLRTWNLLSKYLSPTALSTEIIPSPAQISRLPPPTVPIEPSTISGPVSTDVPVVAEAPPVVEEVTPEEIDVATEEFPPARRNFTPIIIIVIVAFVILLAVSIFRRRR